MSLKALFCWSFGLVLSTVHCSSVRPAALSNYHDYYGFDYYDSTSCEDGLCMKDLYLDVKVPVSVQNSSIVINDEKFINVEKKSAWMACAPKAPANMIADFFEVCNNMTTNDPRAVLGCVLRNRGILTSGGQLNQATIDATFSVLPNASALLDGCYSWQVSSSDYGLLDYYNYSYDYYYGNYMDYMGSYDYSTPSSSVGISKPVKKGRNNGRTAVKDKNGQRTGKNKKGTARDKNRGKQTRKANRRNRKESANKKKQHRNGKKKNKKSKKNEKKKERKATKKLARLRRSNHKAGVHGKDGAPAPSDATLLRGYCVVQAIQAGLEACAQAVLQTNGVPAGVEG